MTQNYHILFICTGNSARSVMSEGLMTVLSKGRFIGYSAGSKPNGKVNPFAIELLKTVGYPTETLRSKSWDEFGLLDAPKMDFIVTVCDNAAGETCPIWPGHPVTAHWGYRDPGDAPTEAEKRADFAEVFEQIRTRINAFLALPLDTLSAAEIKQAMQKIGEMQF